MKVSIVLGNELDSDLLRRWQEMQLANPALASPYFSAGFTRAVASVSDDVEVAVIEENDKVTALLPFERSGAVGMPVGRTLSDYHGLICMAGLVLDPSELIEKCHLLAWEFDHLLASQDCFSPFHWKYDESPQIDLSRGFDAYTSECHEARRIKRKIRWLERDIGGLRFVVHTSDPGALQQTLLWKAQRTFDDLSRGRKRDTIEAILAAQSESFAGMLSVLYAGDRMIAGHFGMRSRTDWHWWFPSYDPTMAKYSPGLILLLQMAKHAASVALRTIDLGKGQARYKDQFKNAAVPLAMGSVALPSWLNFRRTALRHLKSQVLGTPFVPAARLAKREIRRLRYRLRGAV